MIKGLAALIFSMSQESSVDFFTKFQQDSALHFLHEIIIIIVPKALGLTFLDFSLVQIVLSYSLGLAVDMAGLVVSHSLKFAIH